MRRKENKKSRGVAILEFAICLPFFIPITVLTIDLAMMLNQYLLLTQAVHTGTRAATASATLPSGTYQLLRTDPDCPRVGSSLAVYDLQQRVRDLVQLNNSQVDLNTLCVTTIVRNSAAYVGTPEENTILMRVTVNYRTLFPVLPFFRDVSIATEAAGPSLS